MLQAVNRAAQPWKPPHQQVSSGGTRGTSEGCKELPNPHLLPFSASCSLPLLSPYESSSVGRWRGTVNQYPSPGSRDRLLELFPIKTSMLFPLIENVLFSSYPKLQITRPTISFKKLESHLKPLTSQNQIATLLNSGYTASEDKYMHAIQYMQMSQIYKNMYFHNS